jgi:hypothetical protein
VIKDTTCLFKESDQIGASTFTPKRSTHVVHVCERDEATYRQWSRTFFYRTGGASPY